MTLAGRVAFIDARHHTPWAAEDDVVVLRADVDTRVETGAGPTWDSFPIRERRHGADPCMPGTAPWSPIGVRVELFTDQCAAVAAVPELFAALAQRDPEDLDALVAVLLELGAEDRTVRTVVAG